MSNHFSAANLKHPGDDTRLDLTDLFVFSAPGNPGRTVLIMDSNPSPKETGSTPTRYTGSTSTPTVTLWPMRRSASPSLRRQRPADRHRLLRH